MIFVSYAQNFEDVLLWRALNGVANGFYIDVGANDPVVDSVTKAFYDLGWRGINIEPVAEYYKKLQLHRPEDVNLQVAVGSTRGEADFYEVVGTGLSTFHQDFALRHARDNGYLLKSYRVAIERLSTICEEHAPKEIHFLKIDVEGAEADVLLGMDLQRFRPWIVLVESILPNTRTEDFLAWEPILLSAGYDFVTFDSLNRFYVAREHAEIKALLIAPPNLFDGFILSGTGTSTHHAGMARARLDLADCQAQKQQIDAALQEASEHRRQLETHVQALHVEILQRDDLLREKETRQQELLERQLEKDSRLKQLIELQRQLEERVHGLYAEILQRDDLLREKETRQQELLNGLMEKEGRLQQFVAEIAVYKQRIAAMHESLEQSLDRKLSLEADLDDAKGEIKRLEKSCQSTIMQNTEQKQQLALQERSNQEAWNRVHALEEELARRSWGESEALKSLAHNEREWSKLSAHLEEQARQLTLAQQQSALADAKILSLEQELRNSNQTIQSLSERALWLENEWAAANTKVDGLNQCSHHWWTVAEGLQNELRQIYKSKSWRITWPLRIMMQGLKRLMVILSRPFLRAIRFPGQATGWLILKSMTFALERPGLKSWLMKCLRRYPRTEIWWRQFALAHGVMVAPPGSQPAEDVVVAAPTPVSESLDDSTEVDLSDLPPRTRQIYHDLKAALEQNQKVNG